jgi:hypothetical protein
MAGIDFNLLHQLFKYKDGFLIRRIKTSQTSKVGEIITRVDKEGYGRVSIKDKSYGVHRLIFMMFYGYMPNRIDHINGAVNDNRIENLRECTASQNQHNSKMPKTNTTGFKNVYFRKNLNDWYVQVKLNRKVTSVYGLKSAELADLVAQELRNKLHKDFARHK